MREYKLPNKSTHINGRTFLCPQRKCKFHCSKKVQFLASYKGCKFFPFSRKIYMIQMFTYRICFTILCHKGNHFLHRVHLLVSATRNNSTTMQLAKKEQVIPFSSVNRPCPLLKKKKTVIPGKISLHFVYVG